MTNEITILEKEISTEVNKVSALNITDATTMATASTMRAWLKDKTKFLKSHKEVLYRPFKDKIDAINEVYKPFEKQLATATDIIDAEMNRYETLRRKEIAAEEEKIAAKVTSGYIKDETAMVKMAAIEKTETLAETSMINKPIVEIFSALSIPRQYLIPNLSLIEADLKAGIPVEGCKLVDNYIARAK